MAITLTDAETAQLRAADCPTHRGTKIQCDLCEDLAVDAARSILSNRVEAIVATMRQWGHAEDCATGKVKGCDCWKSALRAAVQAEDQRE